MSELSINPPFNSNLSPDEIRRCDPTQLGIGFFCFLVAELLQAKYPQAELWRLTDRERTRYQHVFVRIDGKPCDIGGFRSVDDMRFDLNDYSLIEEITDSQRIKDYFYRWYSPEQLAAAREVLAEAITLVWRQDFFISTKHDADVFFSLVERLFGLSWKQ